MVDNRKERNKMRRKGNKSSSSSTESSSNNHSSTVSSASSSRLMRRNQQQLISTDLQLGFGSAYPCPPNEGLVQNDEYERSMPTKFFVKVYMEGISIGRKLDLLAVHGYYDLINTLQFMFHTTIIWAEGEELQPENSHVLTYEDKEGDWMIVGDVPWEAFLSTVKRLKITRIE